MVLSTFPPAFFFHLCEVGAGRGPQSVGIYLLGSSTCFEWKGSSQVDGVKASSVIREFSR